MGLLDRALDASVVFSFDHTGYMRHQARFEWRDLDVDLHGKVALVTGANSGIGFEVARGLAKRGARVWLLCRDGARGAAAQERIQRETGNTEVELALLDVSDLDQVLDLCEELDEERVDILVHNAGVLLPERRATPAGHELTFATNVLGPFLLTLGMVPRLGEGSRVLWVSSGGMYTQRLNVRELERPADPFDGVLAYAQTKRAEVVLAELLAEKLRPKGILLASMHPGWADTPGVRTSLERFWKMTRSILRTPEEGADTLLWLATCPDLAARAGGKDPSGLFWFDRAPATTHMLPWTRETETLRSDLWALCLSLCPEGTEEDLERNLKPRSARKKR